MSRYMTAGIIGDNGNGKQRWRDNETKDESKRYFLTGLNEDPNEIVSYRLNSCVFRTCCEFGFDCYLCHEFAPIEREIEVGEEDYTS